MNIDQKDGSKAANGDVKNSFTADTDTSLFEMTQSWFWLLNSSFFKLRTLIQQAYNKIMNGI
jgi:hypothetical protein